MLGWHITWLFTVKVLIFFRRPIVPALLGSSGQNSVRSQDQLVNWQGISETRLSFALWSQRQLFLHMIDFPTYVTRWKFRVEVFKYNLLLLHMVQILWMKVSLKNYSLFDQQRKQIYQGTKLHLNTSIHPHPAHLHKCFGCFGPSSLRFRQMTKATITTFLQNNSIVNIYVWLFRTKPTFFFCG